MDGLVGWCGDRISLTRMVTNTLLEIQSPPSPKAPGCMKRLSQVVAWRQDKDAKLPEAGMDTRHFGYPGRSVTHANMAHSDASAI